MDTAEHHTDVQAQSGLDSAAAQPFQPDSSSQYEQQPQYQYGGPHHTAPAFSIDTEMGNMESFAASVRDATDADRTISAQNNEDNTKPTPAGGSIPAGLRLSGPTTPGMAPPQPGQGHRNSIGQVTSQSTPYSPTGPRASIDEAMDPGLSGGDPKRKRSKVSRACDECRRKKVRCDAAGDDGTIKTCTNCAKAGVICGYNRIPMKRGPSKGYIKELSERVQQVESQMAMSGSSGNYRHSTDASTPGGMYGDPSLYSPEDGMSFKRNFSFSDQQAQRNPFATSEYSRDRMPSIGWNPVSPHTSGFRGSLSGGDRHRGSVAIAPDQQAPVPAATSLARPFWMQIDIDSTRPTKRQKMSDAKNQEFSIPKVGQNLLEKYYSEFHSNLPILPDADVAIDIVQQASPAVQHAFIAAVEALPSPKIRFNHSQANGTVGNAGTTSTAFRTGEDLENFVWNAARENPEKRSNEDNLLLLWTYLLMAVEAETDLVRLRDGNLSKALIIKQAVDLGWDCISSNHRKRQLTADEQKAFDKHQLYWARAWYCAGILARLHAIAVGASNPIPLQQETPLPAPTAVFSPAQTFLVVSSVALGSVINLVQNPLPPSQYGKQVETIMRQHVITQLDTINSMAQLDEETETHAQLLRLFFDLLLSRFTFLGAPYEILQPAAEIADALKQHTTASAEKIVYNPYSMHFYILTTVTLLEFIQEGVEPEMDKVANEALITIRSALEQISEKDHIEDQQQQQQQQEQQNTEPQKSNGLDKGGTTSDPSTTAAAEDAPLSVQTLYKPIHWTDALLSMIDNRMKAVTASKENGNNNNHHHNTNPDTKTDFAIAVDFSKLLKHGYLNVLVESAGL